MESGSGGRRVSSRKRNKKQISDMDFSYKPKVAGSLPAVKKNKKDQKARYSYVFDMKIRIGNNKQKIRFCIYFMIFSNKIVLGQNIRKLKLLSLLLW